MPDSPLLSAPGVTVWHGDSLAHPDWWTHADVMITDPPYGRGWRQGDLGKMRGWADDSHPGIPGDDSTDSRDLALRLWGEDRPAVMFGDLMLPPPAGTRQVLVWQKPNNAGQRGATAGFRRDLEAVYLVGRWPSGIGGRTSLLRSAITSAKMGSHRFGHPHAKPWDLMGELIALTAGTVADPFAGTGATLAAARLQGRECVGVEIDADYARTCATVAGQQVLPV